MTEIETEEGGRLADAPTALRFVFGGKAVLTLKSVTTGIRFTYRVSISKDNKVFFVSVLTGPDNTKDYLFIGTIFDKQRFSYSRKSSINPEALSVKAFGWAFGQLVNSVIGESLEIWHTKQCARCGRPLTVPESIRTGFGPECASMVGEV
jgi:Family of unknown function (DUF6011)